MLRLRRARSRAISRYWRQIHDPRSDGVWVPATTSQEAKGNAAAVIHDLGGACNGDRHHDHTSRHKTHHLRSCCAAPSRSVKVDVSTLCCPAMRTCCSTSVANISWPNLRTASPLWTQLRRCGCVLTPQAACYRLQPSTQWQTSSRVQATWQGLSAGLAMPTYVPHMLCTNKCACLHLLFAPLVCLHSCTTSLLCCLPFFASCLLSNQTIANVQDNGTARGRAVTVAVMPSIADSWPSTLCFAENASMWDAVAQALPADNDTRRGALLIANCLAAVLHQGHGITIANPDGRLAMPAGCLQAALTALTLPDAQSIAAVTSMHQVWCVCVCVAVCVGVWVCAMTVRVRLAVCACLVRCCASCYPLHALLCTAVAGCAFPYVCVFGSPCLPVGVVHAVLYACMLQVLSAHNVPLYPAHPI